MEHSQVLRHPLFDRQVFFRVGPTHRRIGVAHCINPCQGRSQGNDPLCPHVAHRSRSLALALHQHKGLP